MCAKFLLVGLLMYKLKLPRFGPMDTIYAAHHHGILDLKGGLGSTLASFISISGGASVEFMVHLFIWGNSFFIH